MKPKNSTLFENQIQYNNIYIFNIKKNQAVHVWDVFKRERRELCAGYTAVH